MSIENVKKFYEAVSQDESLKQKFVELSKKYQGEALDETKMKSITENDVLPLAAQLGYSFTMDDLKAYSEEMKQANMNRELSDEEMQAVAGGGSLICAVIGVGSNSGFCVIIGYAQEGSTKGASCLLAGVGLW